MTNHKSLSDTELLALLKEGDDHAFTEIYKRYWDKVYVVARQRLGDETEAEEVVQDVFYSIWKRRLELEIRHELKTYLSTAVKYQVINRQTRKFSKTVPLNTVLPLEDQGVNSTQLWFSERELKEQLNAEIDKLPEKCKIVFRMSRDEQKTNKQIALELGVTEKNIEAHISRALDHLRKTMHLSLPLLVYLLKK